METSQVNAGTPNVVNTRQAIKGSPAAHLYHHYKKLTFVYLSATAIY